MHFFIKKKTFHVEHSIFYKYAYFNYSRIFKSRYNVEKYGKIINILLTILKLTVETVYFAVF